MTYRAYSSDEVYEIVEDTESPIGLEAVRTDVSSFPEGNEAIGQLPGMHILNKLPGKLSILCC